eukprot:12673_1
MDMVDRLVEYNEENGGVTGAREGSKKNTKKGDGKNKQKSGNKRTGGGGGRKGSNRTNNGGSSGRTNNQNNGDGAGCYCYCGDSENNNDESTDNRRLFGGILGVICIILFIVAMAINVLSKASSADFTVTCRHHEVRGCITSNDCITISYDEDCDLCGLNSTDECKTCDTQSGGKWWLALNIIALIVLAIGVICCFVVHCGEKGYELLKWVKLFYIIAAVLAFISVIAWVGANGYNQSCYDPDNDLGLGTSTIIDIVNGLLLIIGAILVF